MQLAASDAVVAGVAATVVLVVLVWAWLFRRSTIRRLSSLTTRLDEEGGDELVSGGGMERNLARLERAAERAVGDRGSARLARSRLEGALGVVGIGVVVCDESGEIVFKNDQAGAFMGDRPAEALAHQAVTDLLTAAAEGEVQTQTLDLYGPPRRTLTIVASPVDDGWRGLGAVAVIEDVSDRRHLEAVRRDFVANISHELKTPVGALALLAETLAGEDDAEVVNRLARRLQLESQRVARIVDDLLDLSRIESEETPMREPVAVHLVVAEAAERVRSAAEQRAVTITFGEGAQHLVVTGDRRQLVSALFNLLENSVKYSDEGSTVDVRSHTDGEWVELTVTDQGIGIPERDLERVFERFYRVDRARGRDTGGTGLGLAIVRHVANNHGGDVRVESHEGTGSSFTLRIPTGPGPVAVSPAKAG
ncbi:MAG: ATP-binding protein [Actinomycetota bacterium]|nr:ATP-binding protein [Actinomycetota bacterium]